MESRMPYIGEETQRRGRISQKISSDTKLWHSKEISVFTDIYFSRTYMHHLSHTPTLGISRFWTCSVAIMCKNDGTSRICIDYTSIVLSEPHSISCSIFVMRPIVLIKLIGHLTVALVSKNLNLAWIWFLLVLSIHWIDKIDRIVLFFLSVSHPLFNRNK